MSGEKDTYMATAANHYVTQLYHIAVKNNLDVAQILQKCGIDVNLIGQPGQRVSAEKLAALQLSIWQQMGDESMGLAVQPVAAGTYYMMGRLTVNQPTLQKALELGARFYAMMTRAVRIQLLIDADRAFVNFELAAPEMDASHLFSEMLILAWHRYSSWLIADNVPLVETHFNYPRPAHVAEYAYLYPGVHIFNSDKLGFVFPAKYLRQSMEQNDASLKLFMRRCPLELMQRYQADYSLGCELQKLLRKSLSDSVLSIEDAANILNMTKRTLMRKLKGEGTSFQQLKDLVRRDEAIYQLTKSEHPISQISESIGFSEPSVFSRAFLCWTGISPAQYRSKYGKLRGDFAAAQIYKNPA